MSSFPSSDPLLREGKDVGEARDVEDFLDGRLGIGDLHRLARHALLRRKEDAEAGGGNIVDLLEFKDELLDSVRYLIRF